VVVHVISLSFGPLFRFQLHNYGCCCGAVIIVYELASVCQHSIVIATFALQQAAPRSKAARSVRYQNAINERLKAAIK
jgi:hypothetical protein